MSKAPDTNEAANGQSGLTALLEPMPCPFCGSTPKLTNGKVKCTNNQCKVQPKTAAWYMAGYDNLAVTDWNTRMSSNGN